MVAHALIPAVIRQSPAYLCDFEASLVYILSSSKSYVERDPLQSKTVFSPLLKNSFPVTR